MASFEIIYGLVLPSENCSVTQKLMDSRPSIPNSQNDLSNLRRHQSFAKWAAIISVWSPFVVIILISAVFPSYSEAPIERAIRFGETMFGAGGLLAATGLGLACFALRATRKVGRRGVFGRAIFGLIANGLLVCAAVGLIVSLENGYAEIQNLKAQTSAPLSPAVAARRLERARKTLDRISGRTHGDDALVARASSEFLKNLRAFGDDFAAKLKALNNVLIAKLGSIQTRDDLRSRQLVMEQFIDANDLFQKYAAHLEATYSNELIAAGVSSNGIALAMSSFAASHFASNPWDANRAFAQSQLHIVQFLETNWGLWSYNASKDVIECDNAALTKNFQTLCTQSDQKRGELTRAQQKKSVHP